MVSLAMLGEWLGLGILSVFPTSLFCDSIKLLIAFFPLKVLLSFCETTKSMVEQVGVSFASGTKQGSPGNAACCDFKDL